MKNDFKAEEPKVICDVCGRNCNGLIGWSIQLKDEKQLCSEITKINGMFGKTDFNICFTCLLLSLGVKPKVENND